LNPIFCYEICANIAGEALKTGKSIHQIVVEEQGLITQEKWDQIFSVENLIHPKFINR
jgi:aspartate ammonia-lyase